MEDFKFFSNKKRTSTNDILLYSDSERLWCESIFAVYPQAVLDRKYRIISGNDNVSFVMTNKPLLFNVETFLPYYKVRILFDVNGINVYKFEFIVDIPQTTMREYSVCLCNNNDELNQWCNYG